MWSYLRLAMLSSKWHFPNGIATLAMSICLTSFANHPFAVNLCVELLLGTFCMVVVLFFAFRLPLCKTVATAASCVLCRHLFLPKVLPSKWGERDIGVVLIAKSTNNEERRIDWSYIMNACTLAVVSILSERIYVSVPTKWQRLALLLAVQILWFTKKITIEWTTQNIILS